MSLKLTFDVVGKRLVSLNGTPTSLPPFYQGDTQAFQMQFVEADPTATFPSTFAAINYGSSTLTVSCGATPTGTAGTPTPYVTDSTWTWDGTNKWFTGTFDFADADITTAIDTAAYITAYLQFQLTTSGAVETIWQGPITIKAVV